MSVNLYNLNRVETFHQKGINEALANYDPSDPSSADNLFKQLGYLKDDLYDEGESLDQMEKTAASGSAPKGLFDAIAQTYSLGYQISAAQQAITKGLPKDQVSAILNNVWGDFKNAITDLSGGDTTVNLIKPQIDSSISISGNTPLDQAKNVQSTIISDVSTAFSAYKTAYNAASPKGNINDPNLQAARTALVNALANSSAYVLSGTHGSQYAKGMIQKWESVNNASPSVNLENAIGKAYSLGFRITSALSLVSNAATMPDPNSTDSNSLASIIGSASKDGSVLGNMAKIISMLSQ